MTRPWLGVVADDVTGACDLADAVSDQGHSAVVMFGVPQSIPECDCAVIALKSRTAPASDAIAESVAAARMLIAAGCPTIYQKYCSTFDSTDAGNIGPVADELLSLVGASVAVGTPATPRSDRTVYQGHLFVGRQLLSDSSMRDHPLTPMRDSDLVAVLARQTSRPVGLIPRPLIARGVDAVAAAIESGDGHLLLDALDDADLDIAAAALHRLRDSGRTVLVGGAAGLAGALARTHPARDSQSRAAPEVPRGRSLIVSGSCSARTREQVAAFTGPRIELSPFELADDFDATLDSVLAAIERAFRESPAPVLVSSSADPERVRASEQRLGAGQASALLEHAAGQIAMQAVRMLGVRRLLVAGGETSGAVVHALGISALRVGPAVSSGLSWMVPVDGARLVLLLKSGNFGDPTLFNTAWEYLA